MRDPRPVEEPSSDALRRFLASRTGIEAVQSPVLEGALAPDDEDGGTDEELVHLALEELEPPLARIVQLKHFEDLTFEALAERLDISPNTAKTRYYRGLVRLERRLGPHSPNEDRP